MAAADKSGSPPLLGPLKEPLDRSCGACGAALSSSFCCSLCSEVALASMAARSLGNMADSPRAIGGGGRDAGAPSFRGGGGGGGRGGGGRRA